MARQLTNDTRESILADFHVGKSQNYLADKYQVSLATINKLCKGLERKNVKKVKELVKIKQELAAENEKEVNAVREEVNEQTKNIRFLNSCALQNITEAMVLPCREQLDFKHRADTIIKTKETIFGKTPEVAVQVNNFKSLDDIPTNSLVEMIR